MNSIRTFRLPGGVHPLARAAASVIDAGVRPIAVTGLHRDDEHRAEALSIAKAQELARSVREVGRD